MKKKSNCKVRHGGGGLKKLWLIMRFSLLFLFVTLLSVSASSYSQHTKMSVKLRDVTLKEVIDVIQKESDFEFFYNHESVDLQKRVSLSFEEATVEQILDAALKNQAVGFNVVDNVVFLTPGTAVVRQDQKRTISGQVVDASTGETLIGVNLVSVRGDEFLTGTATGVNGDFDLLIASDAEKLMVSMIGYQKLVLPITSESTYFIELNPEVGDIDEVVVTGIFNKTKESYTGVSTTVTHDELVKVNPTNLISALEAFDPGLMIMENQEMGSNPNQMPDILIRGRASFYGNPNTPLFILDGFEVNLETIYDLDLARVDNVSILKDAAAAALYGSRGGNGVIVITTKAPASGKLRFDYTFTGQFEMPDLRDYNLMNSEEKLAFELESGLYDDNSPAEQYRLEQLYNDRLAEVRRGVDTYWIGQPVSTAFNQNHSLYAEGGSDENRFGLTTRLGFQDGVMKGSARNRFGIGFKYLYLGANGLIIRNHLTVDHVGSKESPYGSFSDYTTPNPYDRMYDENGEYRYELSNGVQNPLYEASLASYNKSWYLTARNSLNVEYNNQKGLLLRVNGSLERTINNREAYKDPRSHRFDTNRKANEIEKIGSYSESNGNGWNWETKATLSYNKIINGNNISLGLGGELREEKSESSGYVATGFGNSIIKKPNFALGYQPDGRPSASDMNKRLAGAFVNVMYGYKSRYFLDASFRMDGSSMFGQDLKFAPFWSTGAAWNLHNEGFLKESAWHRLKLRYSMGVTGSVDFPPYMAQTTYSYLSGVYGQSATTKLYEDRVIATLMAMGNPDLKWQSTYKSNLGLEFGLFRRVDGELNVYRDVTHDVLVQMNTAPSIGFDRYYQNAGKILNQGYEVKLKAILLNKPEQNFLVSINGSLLHNKNEILELSSAYKEQNSDLGLIQQLREGESQSVIQLVRSAGIDPANGKEIYITKEGNYTYKYNPEDMVVVGDEMPDASGVLGTVINYRQFGLTLNFRYSIGADVYNSTAVNRIEMANPATNADVRAFEDKWKTPGDMAYYRNIKNYKAQFNRTDRFLQTENIFQLMNFHFEYNFNKAFAKRIGMNHLRTSFDMKDVFRLSTIERERGLSYPFSYVYSFSLKAQF